MQGENMKRACRVLGRLCVIFALAPTWALTALVELIARAIGWAASHPVDWAAEEIERQVKGLKADLMPSDGGEG